MSISLAWIVFAFFIVMFSIGLTLLHRGIYDISGTCCTVLSGVAVFMFFMISTTTYKFEMETKFMNANFSKGNYITWSDVPVQTFENEFSTIASTDAKIYLTDTNDLAIQYTMGKNLFGYTNEYGHKIVVKENKVERQ